MPSRPAAALPTLGSMPSTTRCNVACQGLKKSRSFSPFDLLTPWKNADPGKQAAQKMSKRFEAGIKDVERATATAKEACIDAQAAQVRCELRRNRVSLSRRDRCFSCSTHGPSHRRHTCMRMPVGQCQGAMRHVHCEALSHHDHGRVAPRQESPAWSI